MRERMKTDKYTLRTELSKLVMARVYISMNIMEIASIKDIPNRRMLREEMPPQDLL